MDTYRKVIFPQPEGCLGDFLRELHLWLEETPGEGHGGTLHWHRLEVGLEAEDDQGKILFAVFGANIPDEQYHGQPYDRMDTIWL